MKREKNNSITNQNSIGEKKIYSKSDRAITLIALIVTIIILLILAGISISMLIGDNGLLQRVTQSKEITERAEIIENAKMDILSEITSNNGENISEKQLKQVLNKYFNDIDELEIPNDLSSTEIELTAQKGNYKVLLSEIYNGKLKPLVAGLYDVNRNLIYSWQELIEKNYITVTDNQITNAKQDMESILVIDNSIIGLKQNALYGCSKLTEIIIPDSVTSIIDGGFSGCTSLKKIVLPDNVTTIRNGILSNCNNLKSVTFGDGITVIPSGFFAGNSTIETITLGNNLTEIQGGAFSSCSALKTLALGGKISTITDGAFSGSNNLTDIYYNESEGDWDDIDMNYSHGNDPLKNATKHFAKETSKEVWARIYDIDGNRTLVLDRDKNFTFEGGTLVKTYEEENQAYMTNHRSSYSDDGITGTVSGSRRDWASFSIPYNYPVWYKDSFNRVIINHSIYPDNTSAWFYRFNSIFEFKDLKKLKTKYSTNMSLMFANAFYNYDSKGNKISQINLDLSNFDTSNVTSMAGMFYDIQGCSNLLTNIDLHSFNTEKVTNMDCMFFYFSGSSAFEDGIEFLDLSSFNTSNVTSMKNMFYGCGFNSMKTLKLGNNFDTSKVTDMSYMFRYCGAQKMTSLDLGDKFVINITDASKIKDIFDSVGYNAMTKFDISSISLSNLPSGAVLFNSFGTRDCQIYVKDASSKTWLENKNDSIRYWDNNNIIVGKMN